MKEYCTPSLTLILMNEDVITTSGLYVDDLPIRWERE